ncbi:MAG: T9SS type A sorting domain-containing protein [Salibacteraceae bacterium]|nr:T9SS type A sorting domain-containing protein [Salibacteraceae bacterium]|tara:strand:- start:56788 stop:58089 length:1302 start_codon:yes stop_codon:yes gene_type:complete
MRTILAIVSVFIFQSVMGQITVDRSFMPKSGDKVFYTNAEIGNDKTYETKGASVAWDYSDLTLAFQASEEYKSARSINFFFLTMDFGVKVADSLGFGAIMMRDIYDIYNVTNGAFKAEGRSIKYNGFPIPQNYSDKDEIYKFPLDYGDNDTSTFKVSFNLQGLGSIVQQGTRINEVEGWGDLKLPYKTFSNCIKIKTTIDGFDSLKFMGINIPIPNRRIEYKWFAAGIKNPILIISGTLLGNSFTPTNVKYQEEEKEIIGFYAIKNELLINESTELNDTSSMSGIFRQWEISPETYTLGAGANLGDSSLLLSFTTVGKYSISLTKRNRYGTKLSIKVDYIKVKEKQEEINTSSIGANLMSNGISIYPNPFSNKLNVESSSKIISIRLIDNLGQTVAATYGNAGLIELDELPRGSYIVEAITEHGRETRMVIKN